MATTKTIQSVERAFSILEYLQQCGGGERSVKEIEYEENGIKMHYAWFNAKNKKALRRNAWKDTKIRDYIFVK